MPAWTGVRRSNNPITFTPRTPDRYIAAPATPYHDRRWSGMMKKSGYFQKTGCVAYDADGTPCEVIELYIEGMRHAIRRADLSRAIAGRVCVQVEALVHNWGYYLGAVTGLAQISASGKALNIDLFGAGGFTVSLSALRLVLYGKERNAVIVKIPEHARTERFRKIPHGQQHFGALVS